MQVGCLAGIWGHTREMGWIWDRHHSFIGQKTQNLKPGVHCGYLLGTEHKIPEDMEGSGGTSSQSSSSFAFVVTHKPNSISPRNSFLHLLEINIPSDQ